MELVNMSRDALVRPAWTAAGLRWSVLGLRSRFTVFTSRAQRATAESTNNLGDGSALQCPN